MGDLFKPSYWIPANRNRPFVAISCPDCGEEAVLERDDGFRCVYGHRYRRTELEFDCPEPGCKKSARVDPDGKLRCTRGHEFTCE